jgi:5-formyltetrahydrofolate cyclo-ligase
LLQAVKKPLLAITVVFLCLQFIDRIQVIRLETARINFHCALSKMIENGKLLKLYKKKAIILQRVPTCHSQQKLTPRPEDGVNRNEIRANIRAARRSISPEQQAVLGQQACENMLSKIKYLAVKHVAVYLTNDGELDSEPLIQALWERGIKVYLPKLHPFSKGNLLFLAYTQQTPMLRNTLGILEPVLDIRGLILPEQLNLIVTPLVAFDKNGNRMGMGGGYYDRTLVNWEKAGTPLPIGYAHDCQQVDHLSCEHWDIPLPTIVTPTKIWDF